MSPDWSDDPDPVPYVDFEDPQSLTSTLTVTATSGSLQQTAALTLILN